MERCPADVFDVIWKTYLEGKLARLTIHPVANFVVAKALDRVSESQLSRILEELDGVWGKLVRSYWNRILQFTFLTFSGIDMARSGVIRAIINRVSALNASGLKNIPEVGQNH